MYYVYIARSKKKPKIFYAGYTSNIQKRIERHNSGWSVYSKRYAPWYIETYICFAEKRLALQFENYLKSASGKAFLTKRLIRKTI
ncbi:MAG: GIY-YIG nuclease family protein [Candidatus Omnitrophota bacterium]